MIYIMEHEHKMRADIRSALQYPVIVLSFLIISFFVLLTYVIPKFAVIFERAGLQLPLLTRICVAMYEFLLSYWPPILIVGAGAIVFIAYYVKTDKGRLFKDTLLLNLPLLGPLFTKAAMSRFASIFSILQSSGVAVLESMHILSGTMNNAAISLEFGRITERLEEGRGISVPLRQARYFTPIVINMVAIGEESGNMEEMLNDISTHYDDELEYAMKRLSDSVGPIMTIGLAAVIGFFCTGDLHAHVGFDAGGAVGRILLKDIRFHINLYIIIPLIFAGFSTLSLLVAYRLTRFYLDRSLPPEWPVAFWGIILVLFTFGCGLVTVKFLIDPVKKFVNKTQTMGVLQDIDSPPSHRRPMPRYTNLPVCSTKCPRFWARWRRASFSRYYRSK